MFKAQFENIKEQQETVRKTNRKRNNRYSQELESGRTNMAPLTETNPSRSPLRYQRTVRSSSQDESDPDDDDRTQRNLDADFQDQREGGSDGIATTATTTTLQGIQECQRRLNAHLEGTGVLSNNDLKGLQRKISLLKSSKELTDMEGALQGGPSHPPSVPPPSVCHKTYESMYKRVQMLSVCGHDKVAQIETVDVLKSFITTHISMLEALNAKDRRAIIAITFQRVLANFEDKSWEELLEALLLEHLVDADRATDEDYHLDVCRELPQSTVEIITPPPNCAPYFHIIDLIMMEIFKSESCVSVVQPMGKERFPTDRCDSREKIIRVCRKYKILLHEFMYRKALLHGPSKGVALPQGTMRLLAFNAHGTDGEILQSEVRDFTNAVFEPCVSQQQMIIIAAAPDIKEIQRMLLTTLLRVGATSAPAESTLYSMSTVHEQRRPLLHGGPQEMRSFANLSNAPEFRRHATSPGMLQGGSYATQEYPHHAQLTGDTYDWRPQPLHSMYPTPPQPHMHHFAPLFFHGGPGQQQYPPRAARGPPGLRSCFGCGQPGHMVAFCITSKACDAHGGRGRPHKVGDCMQYTTYLGRHGLTSSTQSYDAFKARHIQHNSREEVRGRVGQSTLGTHTRTYRGDDARQGDHYRRGYSAKRHEKRK